MIRFGEQCGAIVCGGRNYRDRKRVYAVLDRARERFRLEFIVQGAADGADFLAWQWAEERGLPCGSFPADWSEHGKRAGLIRNQKMLDEAKPCCVIAFPGGKGTADMVSRARSAGVPVYEIP